jgi:hypothetical protein
MDHHQLWNDLVGVFDVFRKRVMELLPHLVGALLIFLAGLLIAHFLRILIHRTLKNLSKVIPHRGIQVLLPPDRMERTAAVVSNIFYWVIVFLFLTAATEMLELSVLTNWLSGIATYLPKIITAILIIMIGFIAGRFLREIILSSMGALYGGFLGKVAQYSVVAVTILIGIDQMQIHIAFLTDLILIVVGGALFGAALAFGLGAKTSVCNILACFYLQKIYKVGQRVRIGSLEGKITRFSSTAVLLEGAEGEICLPAKEFWETPSVLLREGK